MDRQRRIYKPGITDDVVRRTQKSTDTCGSRAGVGHKNPRTMVVLRRCEMPDNGSGTKEEIGFEHRRETKSGILLVVPPGEVLVWVLLHLRRLSNWDMTSCVAVAQGGGREGRKRLAGKECHASSAKLAMLSAFRSSCTPPSDESSRPCDAPSSLCGARCTRTAPIRRVPFAPGHTSLEH